MTRAAAERSLCPYVCPCCVQVNVLAQAQETCGNATGTITHSVAASSLMSGWCVPGLRVRSLRTAHAVVREEDKNIKHTTLCKGKRVIRSPHLKQLGCNWHGG